MNADDELVEKMARVLKEHPLVPFTHDAALTLATAALAAARPVIRAEALEEAAKVCDAATTSQAKKRDATLPTLTAWQIYNQGVFVADKNATAIRALLSNPPA